MTQKINTYLAAKRRPIEVDFTVYCRGFTTGTCDRLIRHESTLLDLVSASYRLGYRDGHSGTVPKPVARSMGDD